MEDTFAALGHPARRSLVDELRGGPRRAGDLGHDLGMSREAVSKHLRVLAAAGLVTAHARGRERWHALEPSALRPVDDWLEPYRAFWRQRLDALETEVARGRHHERMVREATDQPAATSHSRPAAPARPLNPPHPDSKGA